MDKGKINHQICSTVLTAEKDDSLGIINMDNIRVFGDTSNTSKNKLMTNDRLKAERIKALNTLQKASFSKSCTADNKENNKQMQNSLQPYSYLSNRGNGETDDVPQRSYQTSLNISDLIIENTIHLESSSTNNITSSINQKVSFEPSEITGRSTCRDVDLLTLKSNELSVEQILASSCSENVRSLCDSISESYDDDNNISLPRTADMSRNSKNSSFQSNGMRMFSFSNAPKYSESEFNCEDFIPAEMMKEKMTNDEQEWAQQYLTMPASENLNWSNDFLTNSNSNVMNNENSVGSYFNHRCENLVNIVSQTGSPEKNRTPVALIDESIKNTNNESLTPIVDGKYYSRYSRALSKSNKRAASDNSENTSENSYLSMSAIEKVLNVLQTDDSDNSLVNRLMLAKKTKSCMNPCRETKTKSVEKNEKISCNSEYIRTQNHTHHMKNNKENVNLTNCKDIQFSDTVSISESLLNCTETKNFKKSDDNNENSMCPIKIKILEATNAADATEADVENSNYSPLQKNKSRQVYSKSHSKSQKPSKSVAKKKNCSPNTKTKLDFKSALVSPNQKSNNVYKNQAVSPTTYESSWNQDSFDPKRIFENTNSILNRCNMMTPEKARSEECGNFIRPSEVKSIINSPTLLNTDNDITLKPDSKSEQLNKNIERSESPEMYDTPLSSPRSCLSSNLGSPRWNGAHSHSPSLETTTNSERRFLTNRSSPDFGKISLPSYGILTSRSASTMSLKSARCSSQCSNSSEFNHRDGKKIPLKVTCYEMCWGSSKLRCYDKKKMQIKNTSAKRLILKVAVSGPGFQMVDMSANLITLQPQECRSISLVFCPTVIGAAVGVLFFSPPNGNIPPFLEIPLYGYGGHTSISPQGILKGPVGSPFLTMGELGELSQPLIKIFKIYNKGPLFGFASIFVDSVGLDVSLSGCIEIMPNKMIISPESTAKVRVTFRPRRDDLRKILKRITNVMTIANLKIVCGDEPTRQRIRNLVHRLNETEKTKISSPTLDQVWNKFPNEQRCEDLNLLKEGANICFDLISSFRIHDIALTLNNMDDTNQSTIIFHDADETVLFRTIIASSPNGHLEDLKEVDDDNQQSSSLSRSNKEEMWAVRPNKIDINPIKWNGSGSFQIKSYFIENQYFEVSCNFKHLFNFSPKEGNIASGDEIEIGYSFQNQQLSVLPNDINFLIYVENERLKIPVNIIKDNYPAHLK